MSEMIERVAKAIAEDMGVNLAFTDGFPSDTPNIAFLRKSDTEKALKLARAAIEAMRDPTDAMVLAGAKYYHDNWRPGHAREDTSAEDIWHDMLDVALAEPQP